MGFVGSHLWKVRQQWGSGLLLVPGAMVLVQAEDGKLLYTKRSDDGEWCFPGGAAEEGGSFLKTAIDELYEETGLRVEGVDLTAFGTLSEANLQINIYPNGDVTHCFGLLLFTRRWSGSARVTDETTDLGFYPPTAPPRPLQAPSEVALSLFQAFCATGVFQVR